MTSRGRSPRFVPPATRSQKPAPKSAPPKIAYMVIADEQDDGGGGAHQGHLERRLRLARPAGSLGP